MQMVTTCKKIDPSVILFSITTSSFAGDTMAKFRLNLPESNGMGLGNEERIFGSN